MSKDSFNPRIPVPFSTIASGHPERETKKKAEFTADDFPALSNSTTRSSSFDEYGMKKQVQYSVKAGSNHSSKSTSQVTSPNNSKSSLNLNQSYQQKSLTSPKLKDEKSGQIDSLINSTSKMSLQSDSVSSSGPSKQKQENKNDKYSINSLLDQKREENILNTGSDILSFGFDLNDKKIYPKFSSPFSNKPKLFPKNQLPTCFSLPQMPPPIITRIGVFSDETLFYIFYTMPKEAIQEAAAQELYNRNWRYHKQLRIWLAKELGSEDVVKGLGCERGLYLYFDPINWEKKKREFIIYYEQLEERGPVGISLYNRDEEEQQEEENEFNEANINNIALMNMLRQGNVDGINASILNNMNMANRQILADQAAINQFSFTRNNQMANLSPLNNPSSQQQANNNLFSVFGAVMNNPSVINQLQQQNYLNQAGNNPGNININNINPLLGLNNANNNNKGQIQNGMSQSAASANINNNNLNKGMINLPMNNLNSMNNINLNALKSLSGMNMNGMGIHMNNMNLNGVNMAMNNNSIGK